MGANTANDSAGAVRGRGWGHQTPAPGAARPAAAHCSTGGAAALQGARTADGVRQQHHRGLHGRGVGSNKALNSSKAQVPG